MENAVGRRFGSPISLDAVAAYYPDLDPSHFPEVGTWAGAQVLDENDFDSIVFACSEMKDHNGTWEVAVTGLLLDGIGGVLKKLAPPRALKRDWLSRLLLWAGFPGPGKTLKAFLDEMMVRNQHLLPQVRFLLFVKELERKPYGQLRRVVVQIFRLPEL